MSHLTETIKRLRHEERECTTWRISEIAELDPPHVRRICAGKRVPKLGTLWKLANALRTCSSQCRDSGMSTADVFRILLEALARDIQELVERETPGD